MNKKFNAGFTLLELLLVIVVISMLLGILLPAFSRIKESARKRQNQSNLDTLSVAVRNYHHEYDEWPIPDPDVFSSGAVTSLVFTADNFEVITLLSPAAPELNFIQTGNYSLDANGSVKDPWGEPYVFTFKADSNNFYRIDILVERQ